MTLMELKEKAAQLSLEERLQLAAFLAELEKEKEAEFRQTVNARMRAMDGGRKIGMEDFEAEHRRLASGEEA